MTHKVLLEKAMAPHSSTLAWRIPWMEEPGGLQSMGSLRVGHNWATSLSLFTFMHWRRKWQPTPVFLPGESQGRGSLVGYRLWVAQSRTRLKRLSSSSSIRFCKTKWVSSYWDFFVAQEQDSMLQGSGLLALVGELDPACPNQRSHVPQLRLVAAKTNK